jgi:cytochrome c553
MLLLGQVSYVSAQTPNSASRAITILKENCLSCHGGQKMSGLDMRSRETLLTGGKHGKALVVGKPDQSLLYRFVAGKEKIQMPPGKRLPEADIATLKAWIAAGAGWSGGKQTESLHWSFRPVVRPPLPHLKKTANPVDSFILAKLQTKGLPLSPRADKRTLIRRAYFDLWGMPPTPKEVQEFVSDTSPKAWENLIDRLLASPHYGERWARHWLDISRYAESNGFKTDEARPNAWRYRDYVIQALNADTPFDRFIKEQIAGDEIYPASPSAKIATGFNTHFPDESNAQDLRMRRQDILNDITDTVGAALMGVTLGCARCHDHKYDPISQKDYYSLQSFFAGIRLREDMVLLSPKEHTDWKQRQETWEQKTESIRARLAVLEEPVRKTFFESRKARFPKDVQDSIDTPEPKRTSLQRLLYFKALPQLEMTEGDVANGMNGTKPAIKAEWKELTKKIEQFRSIKPEPLPLAQGINDVGREVPTTHILAGGSHNKPLEEVKPAFLGVLTTAPPRIQPSQEATSGRRAVLAEWLASPQNPLTTRVIVNRVWHYHFGRGIVATPNDFGKTGELPTHPELLDWLTSEFVRKGWSLKQLHRLLMTSATYQQSSRQNPTLARKDPENHLFGRYMRRRVEGEVLRDSLLSVSGELDLTVGGKSVMPPLPTDVTTRGYWKDATDPKERNRRSVYIFVKRNLRYPFFAAFDMPDTHDVCARRQVTITPLQSLLLLNEETVLQSSRTFASRVLKKAQGDPKVQVEAAWQLAFQRAPSPTEAQEARCFLLRQTEIITQRLARKERLLVPDGLPTGMTSAQGAALVDLCHALYNSNEFVTWE